MERKELLNRLISIYRQSFDIQENYEMGGEIYDAYGFCNITNSKYVLVKKAELWRALCFEHVFFKGVDVLDCADVENFCTQTVEYIEPQLVRKGEKCTVKDHMYSYITCVFVCENGLAPDALKKLKKSKFFKNYMLSVRGYSELRLLAVDLKSGKVYGNAAARDLIKEYKENVL